MILNSFLSVDKSRLFLLSRSETGLKTHYECIGLENRFVNKTDRKYSYISITQYRYPSLYLYPCLVAGSPIIENRKAAIMITARVGSV